MTSGRAAQAGPEPRSEEGESLLVEPHGGALVDAFVNAATERSLRERAAALPQLTLDARELADLELMACGAASPLRGYLCSGDYRSVLRTMRLADGTLWPLPFTLAVPESTWRGLEPGGAAALHDAAGRLWGLVEIEDLFERDALEEARHVYATEDAAHPGVAYLLERPRFLVGGRVRVLPLPAELPFARYRLTPRELRAQLEARGWKSVAGFQTRNPIHRAHEHLTKVALEMTDGLVIHPLVGETKGDDVPAEVRFRAYEVLVERYYPRERTLLAAFPAAMRYAGPREALFHAIARKNYGISHLIVGRDHAGVGRYYGPFEAHALLDRVAPELGATPIKLDIAFYCRACGNLASTRTCPHGPAERVELSGTRVRELLRAGETLPREFSRPEVAEVLRAHYAAAPADAAAAAAPGSQADGRDATAGGTASNGPQPNALLPLFLKIAGRRVVVVGGGAMALTKTESLLRAGARVTVVAPEVRPELDRPELTIVRRAFQPSDLDAAWLAIAAAPPQVNRAVREAADERGVFVNAIDDPETASAFAGGVLTRGGVTLAVSSHGHAPALSGLLREALDAVLPDDIDRWLDEARSQRSRWREAGVPIAERRPLLLQALNRLYAPDAS